jgi:hypothetical protein
MEPPCERIPINNHKPSNGEEEETKFWEEGA